MSVRAPDEEIDRAWAAWLLDRNRRGALLIVVLVMILHPTFAVLDTFTAPHRVVRVLFASRVAGVAITLALWRGLGSELFRRYATTLTAAYTVVVALGLTVMTVVLGGFGSSYYAGLNLVMFGAGLIFVWPRNAVVAAHGAIFGSYVVANLAADPSQFGPAALSPIFFVGATAFTVSAGQIFAYRQFREQLENRLALEHASTRLTRAHEELQRLDQFKSRFFANITHELKTPLAMILSPVELMISGEFGRLDEPQRATLRSVHRNGSRLLRLIGDLLDLSRLEESRLRLRVEENDLTAYLRSLVAQVEPLTTRKQIAVAFEARAPAATAWCDLDRMERVFVNLLSNAAKFTPIGGHVTVSVDATETHVTACVADDGPGFPKHMAEEVFQRFFQVDNGASHNRYNQGGTGIGLALARELVELHGGRIWAESEPGRGARFFVELPRDRAHLRDDVIDARSLLTDAPDERRSAEATFQDWTADLATRDEFRLMDVAEATERRVVERDADESARTRTILVVEDTPDVIRVVHMILRQHFRILTAPDGRRGLELALRERPHLVITDLMMPEMDGYELVRALRADPATRRVPVVMLTARGETEDKVQGLEAGVNAYLTKPFAARELLATVRKLLELEDSTADLLLTRHMDSLEIVAGGLAHEINNPLNYIKNSLGRVRKDVDEVLRMVRTGDAPEAKLKSLEARTGLMFKTAESGVARIADTVALMGRYSREGYSRQARAHDLFAAARDVVEMVLPATGRRVEVTTRFDGDGAVECVPEEMHQVLANLVQNAIEASPDGAGRVEVTGEADAEGVTLTVQDNGGGVKPEDRGKIFTPFFTTKGPGAGMGMGLTISWRVVHSLGGTLTEEGNPGEGARFVVRLPRRAKPGSRVTPTPERGAPATSAA